MSLINEEDSILLIIDVQEKLVNAIFNKDFAESKSAILAKAANILNIPAIVTEQYPKGLGNTVLKIKESLLPETKFFEKTSFSALDSQDLFEHLKNIQRKQIIIFGIETHICVSQSANALVEAGYEVFVVSDACGSRAETEHLAGLSRMKDNGVKTVTTEIVLFELLKSAKHPNFKEIQNLIK